MQLIIAIEGIDGAGKTVQASLLAKRAELGGYSVFVRDYPRYESFFGKKIGELLADKSGGARAVDPYSMCLWYASDRYVDYITQIYSRVENTDIIIFNRYTLSSQIFQSARTGDEAIMGWIDDLEHVQFGLPRPDAYIVIDCDPEVSRARNAAKSKREYLDKGADVYEADQILQKNAALLYRKIAREREDVLIIGDQEETSEGPRLRTVEQVSNLIAKVIYDRLGLKI